MGGYLRLSDLGRPVQDDLDKDTNQKEWHRKWNPEEKEFQIEEMAVQGMASTGETRRLV